MIRTPSTEPNIEHEIKFPDEILGTTGETDHTLKIWKKDNTIIAEHSDNRPVFNEDRYKYKIKEDGEMEFVDGKHSCSGAGKFRYTEPSDKLDDKIRELTVPLREGVVKHES